MDDTPSAASTRFRSTFVIALCGALALAVCFPPFDLWPLAWIATAPWLYLAIVTVLPGRRPYLSIFCASYIYWGIVLYWLTLAHWAGVFSLLALAGWNAIYLPIFIAACRVVVPRRPGLLPLVAPLVWMGCEYARTWVLSGFSMVTLANTQNRFLTLIQCADLGGATLVGGLILLPICAAIAIAFQPRERRLRYGVITIGITILLIDNALRYGRISLREPLQPVLNAALIQGSIDARFDGQISEEAILKHYVELTQAVTQTVAPQSDAARFAPRSPYLPLAAERFKANPLTKIDLLVWPEAMYRRSIYDFGPAFRRPAEMPMTPAETAAKSREQLVTLFRQIVPPGTPALLGGDRIVWHSENLAEAERYNSAIFIAADQTLGPIYDKQHLVPFGEFIPLGKMFPWIYRFTHLSAGQDEGISAQVYTIAGIDGPVRIAPNICYETVIPQVPRRHLLELHARGETPDVLVNVTNDGWFYGSGELDMHLHCGVLRAIETRKPLLIAANTGFSAAIDPHGRITAQGKRREPDILPVQAQVLAERPRDELTFYVRYGELPGQLGFAVGCGLLTYGWVQRRRG